MPRRFVFCVWVCPQCVATLRASYSTAVPLKKLGLVAVQNFTGFTNTTPQLLELHRPVLDQLACLLGAFAHVGYVPMPARIKLSQRVKL